MYRRQVSASSIIQSAWDVLKGNKSMLIFPLLAFISAILIICSFTHSFTNLASFSNPSSYYEYFKLWLFYFINYFILTFFNVGLTCCALRKLQNESTTFKDGILEACKKIHLILSWSLFFASVAIIFQILEDKLSWFGKLITNIFEIAFSLASYLVTHVTHGQF
ncbi:DUF6159 family protein [Legionella sp. km772]|uniref:DUF6159 family protein n=1 Tax=Legionella sp. km772 TaxID=2498111 RepID=UPI000F8F2025|nr:DUF6159 family protein [Legionella sp. km772]RUR07807.1 hypothetical protein ELY15_11835 [Legionella sp. km772]